jgi:toxin HigB-1
MIQSFRDSETEAIYTGRSTKAARRRLPDTLWRVAQRKLVYLASAAELRDLSSPPGNHLEALKDDRLGQHAIRINDQYRICFVWSEAGPEQVEITDYH